MSENLLSLNAHWREKGLIGEKAVHFGGPDELLLYSGCLLYTSPSPRDRG